MTNKPHHTTRPPLPHHHHQQQLGAGSFSQATNQSPHHHAPPPPPAIVVVAREQNDRRIESNFRALSLIMVGIFLGFALGFNVGLIQYNNNFTPVRHHHHHHHHQSMDDKNNNCKVCDEDKYRYMRKRVPFVGPLGGDWFHQYDNCVPSKMRYQFTFNGTIGVDSRPPSDEGKPPPEDARWRVYGGAQIYTPLNTRPDLWGATNNSRVVWSKELLDFLISEISSGKDISCDDYPKSALDVGLALELLGVGPDDRLLVAGSISPWVEAVALHANTGEVTTIDYSEPYCDDCHPRLRTMNMDTSMRRSTPAGYSHIVSYSSIEHDGLGRYGDPLDPYGDQHAMNEFWSLLKVDGILLLAVPLWPRDRLAQLLARLYGPIRLPWLISGWEYLGCVNRGVWSTRVPFRANDWGWHPIIALRKTSDIQPTDSSSVCTLDCAYSGAVKNRLLGYESCGPSANCGNLSHHWPHLAKYPRVSGQRSEVDIRIIKR